MSQRSSSAVLRLRAGRHERAFRAGLAGMLVRLLEYVISWDQGRRDRRVLARLDERMLRDIGIDRAMVENDSTASFWRLR